MDVVEVNEALAVVPLIVGQELGYDHTKMNRKGGSVAMGSLPSERAGPAWR